MKLSRLHSSLFLSAALAVALLSGCAHYPGGVAPSSTPLEGRKYSVLGKTYASDNRVCLLGMLPITPANSIRHAIDLAAKRAGGDALIDVTVECYTQYWILFSRDVIKVEGIAIRFDN